MVGWGPSEVEVDELDWLSQLDSDGDGEGVADSLFHVQDEVEDSSLLHDDCDRDGDSSAGEDDGLPCAVVEVVAAEESQSDELPSTPGGSDQLDDGPWSEVELW